MNAASVKPPPPPFNTFLDKYVFVLYVFLEKYKCVQLISRQVLFYAFFFTTSKTGLLFCKQATKALSDLS